MADEHEAYIRSSRAFHHHTQDHSNSSDGSDDEQHHHNNGYDLEDDDEVYVVPLDDEYKRQLCLGAVDTLANSLAFQNWLNATKFVPPKYKERSGGSSSRKKRVARIWKIDTTSSNQEMIVSWKKIGTENGASSSRRRRHIKYNGYDDSDSDDETDVASSDDEEYAFDEYSEEIKLEYFTVATESNVSNTVKLVTEDLLKWLPPSAPTQTKQFIKKYSDKLLRADTHLFNALSCTLMISGALSSSSRSTISNTNQELSKTSTHRNSSSTSEGGGGGRANTMLMMNPLRNKHHARRWAHFAFPVNRNQDGFQYILVDTSPLDEDIDVSLNSVVNATFAISEKLVIHDMITSVKTCLTKRNIPYEEKSGGEKDDDDNNGDWPSDPASANNTILLCKQGLVNPNSNNNNPVAVPVPDNVPTAMTQFEFDQHGNLQDIGLSFG